MKIKYIHIKNFKSFGEQIINLENLTILLGANASGKSNTVSIIRFVNNIILYGLDDDNEKSIENSSYSEYLDAFDFTGLVEQKLKDSEARCLFLRQWSHFTRVRYLFVTAVMILTALLLIIIKFF